MIRVSLRYIREEVFPRFGRIVFTSGTAISVCAGVAFGIWGERFLPDTTKVVDVGVALLTYSAIAQGFCLAGYTLLLTLPNQEFLTRLATWKEKPDRPDAYSDLLFVFSWTAVVHWVVLVISILLIMFAGSQQEVWPPHPTLRYKIIGGGSCGISIYGLFQFLITLITLSQVGRLNIAILKSRPNNDQNEVPLK